MKKSFTKILSFVMIMAITVSLFTFNVSAASATISGTGEYEVGKSFSVTIRFNADATLYAVEADVSYNSSVLRLNSVSGADYNIGNGSVKIVDDGFSATKPSKTSSYTLNFTAIAAGNSNISVSLLGAGEATSKASASAAVTVVTPKPSSNANLASIKLSSGSLSPAFNANTTNYNVTVKYDVDEINITGSVADGKSRVAGGGTLGLNVGNNECVLTVTAEDGTKKSYIINIKRMTEEETLAAEEEARNSNPLLVVIDGVDYTIVNNFEGITIPTGFTQGTATRKESEITVLNDAAGKYQLCWLVDQNGENGAFYSRDAEDNFTKLAYINANGIMYIIEKLDIDMPFPIDYKRTTYTINGVAVEMIAYEDEALSDFAIFNCYISGQTKSALYRYDIVEGTMQRAIDFDAALTATETDTPIEQEQNTGKFAWFTNMNKTGKIVFLIIVFAAVLLIAVAVILIIKIASSGKDDYEDEYISEANNDFVLNDFAEEITDNTKTELSEPIEETNQENNGEADQPKD